MRMSIKIKVDVSPFRNFRISVFADRWNDVVTEGRNSKISIRTKGLDEGSLGFLPLLYQKFEGCLEKLVQKIAVIDPNLYFLSD